MPTQIQPTSTTESSVETTPDFNAIGVEFEYPVGDTPAHEGPDLYAERSSGMVGEDWQLNIDGVPDVERDDGDAGHDHVGAEVRSPVFDLHTTQPETWYRASIIHAEELGYNFAANGRGETNFGLHMHLSQLSDEQASALHDMCLEPWMRIFACASLSNDSADPWRHGGVTSGSIDPQNTHSWDPQRMTRNGPTSVTYAAGGDRHSDGHYEWRLPEPMMPDHFEMMMHFLRLLSLGEIDEAREYARGAVMDRDSRLTAIQQYRTLAEEYDDWPERGINEDTSYINDSQVEAEKYMASLMGDL